MNHATVPPYRSPNLAPLEIPKHITTIAAGRKKVFGRGGKLALAFSFGSISSLFRRHRIKSAEPAVKIDIGAARRTEGVELT